MSFTHVKVVKLHNGPNGGYFPQTWVVHLNEDVGLVKKEVTGSSSLRGELSSY